MLSKIERTIKQHNMIKKGDRILVAFSGGADSVTLLHYLAMNSEKYGITVAAAHVNHMLRGEESGRDEQFCYDFCEALNVPLYIKTVDINSLSKQQKLSTETCARNVRYDFFNEITSGSADFKIATAHTLSDCCETLILNLTRGSSMTGLGSIPPVRGSIIRPLISCAREEIERYIEQNYLQYVTDSTNLTNDYTRNLIRHEVMPVLKSINSNAEISFSRAIESVRRDEQYLNDVAKKAYNDCLVKGRLSCDKIKALPDSIRLRAIKMLLQNICGEISNELILSVDEAIRTNKTANLPQGKKLICSDGFVTIGEQKNIVAAKDMSQTEIKPDNTYEIAEKKVTLSIISNFSKDNTQNINKKFVNNYLDYDMIIGTPYIRTRRDGDKFSPKDRRVTKSLKKLFNELKISPAERDSLVLLCDDEGIIFIEGIGCCDRVKPTDKTVSVVALAICNKTTDF